MKLLWISTRWPFPADDGAKQASASLLLALAELGHDLGVVTFAREAVLAPSPHARVKLLAHYRANSLSVPSRVRQVLGNLGSALPVSAAPFAEFRLSWKEFEGFQPRAVVADGPHGYAAFDGAPCPWPMIYRAHNNETSIWEQAAAKAWIAPYFSLQARRMRRFEGGLGEACRGIAAISPDDARQLRGWFPRANVKWVPMGFPFREPAPAPDAPLTIGYLGRMDWPPNRDGLAWFLDKVWPAARAQRPGLKLLIAGSGDAGWLSSRANGVFEWLGRVDSVDSFYAGVHAVIAPVHFGGGTKIKVVEAASRGRAVFATTGAQRGSGLGSASFALLSDDPGTWARALATAREPELAAAGALAFAEARALFGEAEAARNFLSLIEAPGA